MVSVPLAPLWPWQFLQPRIRPDVLGHWLLSGNITLALVLLATGRACPAQWEGDLPFMGIIGSRGSAVPGSVRHSHWALWCHGAALDREGLRRSLRERWGGCTFPQEHTQVLFSLKPSVPCPLPGPLAAPALLAAIPLGSSAAGSHLRRPQGSPVGSGDEGGLSGRWGPWHFLLHRQEGPSRTGNGIWGL